MSIHFKKPWSLISLAASMLLLACSEEPDTWIDETDEEVAARDLSLCASVPADATLTLSGSGTYTANSPDAVMSQPGCDGRFVVDFDSLTVGTVHLSSDLHHFLWTDESWAYDDSSSCNNAHATLDVYTKPQIGAFSHLGSFSFVGEWEDGACKPLLLDDQRLPLIPGSVARIRLAVAAWVTQTICLGGSGPSCTGGVQQPFPVPTWKRAQVVVP